MEDSGRYEKQVSLGQQVARAFEKFWKKNQLSVDRKGKVYRTNVPRERPNLDHVDFRKVGKRDGKQGY